MPDFCRVLILVQPEIRIEVSLPANWNRRLYMFGNGGFAGEDLETPERVANRNAALKLGFAVTQTNTGHDATTEPLAARIRWRTSWGGSKSGAVPRPMETKLANLASPTISTASSICSSL